MRFSFLIAAAAAGIMLATPVRAAAPQFNYKTAVKAGALLIAVGLATQGLGLAAMLPLVAACGTPLAKFDPALPRTCERNGGLAQGVDLALFNVSLHHGHRDGNVPFRDEIEAAADRIAAMWPDPDTLVIALPAGPTLGPKQYPGALWINSSIVFRNRLQEAYGGYDFDYHESDGDPTDTTLKGTNNSAVIIGHAWKFKSKQGTERHFHGPVDGKTIIEGKNFGDFVIARNRKDDALSVHIITAQTQHNDEDIRASQIRDFVNYGDEHRGSEPTLIIGDFNWAGPEDPLGLEIRQRLDWLTYSQKCDNLPGVTAFESPDIMNNMQMKGADRMQVVGFPLSEGSSTGGETSGIIGMPTLNHPVVGTFFHIKD